MCHRCGEVGGATNQVSGVRFNEERNEQHENRPIYTKLTNIIMHNEFPHGFTLTSCFGPNVGLGEG